MFWFFLNTHWCDHSFILSKSAYWSDTFFQLLVLFSNPYLADFSQVHIIKPKHMYGSHGRVFFRNINEILLFWNFDCLFQFNIIILFLFRKKCNFLLFSTKTHVARKKTLFNLVIGDIWNRSISNPGSFIFEIFFSTTFKCLYGAKESIIPFVGIPLISGWVLW